MFQNTEIITNSLKKRYKQERRFRFLGFSAIALSFIFLAILLIDISSKGTSAFFQTYIKLSIDFDAQTLGINPSKNSFNSDELAGANFQALINQALYSQFENVNKRSDKKALRQLISSSAQYDLRDEVLKNPNLIGTKKDFWIIAKDDVDMLIKGKINRNLPQSDRTVSDQELIWIDSLVENDQVEKKFNTVFFTSGDSRDPEQAGIRGALMGSILTLIITFFLSFPIGVAAALYLEEFAPQNNRFVDFIEININNLAAIPSIVFGLLGLAVFINLFGIPRSAPLVGGLVLTLMTFPTIIIASRASIKSVPPSLREAALGLGASKMQTTLHHILPSAMPGILTGSIIGMARALGESAPLLMIGMIAFIIDVPSTFTEPATALPVQIFLWADSPERAFVEKTSAAIMVLLGFMILMNLIAIILRNKFEKKW